MTSGQSLPRILAVDFDGTLVSDKYPEIGGLNHTLVAFLNSAKSEGVKLILWTCRNGEQLDQAVKFCADNGITFDAVNENLPEVQAIYGGDTRKVFADKYIDDKNIDSLLDLVIWSAGVDRGNSLWQ